MANTRKSDGLLNSSLARSRARFDIRTHALGALALLGGCNWTVFDDYLDEAAIRVHPTPESYGAANYGALVTTWHGQVEGREVSRIFASGGAHTPVGIARAWDGTHISEDTLLRCASKDECSEAADLGSTLIPFPTWGAGTGQERSACVFAPADKASSGGAFSYVLCETNKVPQHFEAGLVDVRGDDGDLQFSGFGLPERHPAGVVLVGAHALDNRTSTRRRGALYAQFDIDPETQKVAPLALVPLLDPATGKPFSAADDAGDLGRQVTGAVFEGGELVVAISQPSKQRVIIASYDERAAGKPLEKFVTRACIESPEGKLSDFGARVVMGDIDHDGKPELFIGSDPTDEEARGQAGLYMYQGSGLPAAAGGDSCPAWNDTPRRVECPNGAGGVSCADAGFGASIAVGDIDGDERGDLIVGAPFASVDGVAEAGAVFIIPSTERGLDSDRAIALTAPAPRARFGWSVAALRTEGRDEPVVGAPGSATAYVFMCTQLESGFGGTTLCL